MCRPPTPCTPISRPETRRCAIPAGVPIFLPAFNMWARGAVADPPAVATAYGELVVDDAPVALDTIATPIPFEVVGASSNPVTGTRRPVAVTVWGLWKRLEPLPVGQHVIRFTGGDGHGFWTTARYHLDVGVG